MLWQRLSALRGAAYFRSSCCALSVVQAPWKSEDGTGTEPENNASLQHPVLCKKQTRANINLDLNWPWTLGRAATEMVFGVHFRSSGFASSTKLPSPAAASDARGIFGGPAGDDGFGGVAGTTWR